MNDVRKTIGWADFTWNPITGCSPVSRGCENCYAAALVKRFPQIHGYTGLGVAWDPMDPDPVSFRRLVFHRDRLEEPLKRKKPARIFVCSMGDLFHQKVDTVWIDRILEVMAACPQHTFIVLTKRPENAEAKMYGVTPDNPCRELGGGDNLRNLWIGVSAENQKTAECRVPLLMQIPAVVRFVSVEPMLGPVNLTAWLKRLDWVIAGPETGPGRRCCSRSWLESLHVQCLRMGKPFYDKRKDYERREWPVGIGKK